MASGGNGQGPWKAATQHNSLPKINMLYQVMAKLVGTQGFL